MQSKKYTLYKSLFDCCTVQLFSRLDCTYQVSGLALQDGGQDIVEADRALEQAGQVTVGGCGAWQGGHALGGDALGGSCGQRGGSLATHFW